MDESPSENNMQNMGSIEDRSAVEEESRQRALVMSLSRPCEAEPKQARTVEKKGAYSEAAVSSRFTPEEERVMVEHLPIVRYIARRIHERLPQHVEMEELVSAGVLGLMDAFQKFDPAKKVQFAAMAKNFKPWNVQLTTNLSIRKRRHTAIRLGRAPKELIKP